MQVIEETRHFKHFGIYTEAEFNEALDRYEAFGEEDDEGEPTLEIEALVNTVKTLFNHINKK
jgi:hypothetical protein